MTGMEFFVGYLSNLKVLFAIVAGVTGVAGVIITIMSFIATGENDRNAPYIRTLSKWFISIFIATSLVACAPDVDDLWRIRVAFIKFQLASPENIQAVVNPENIKKAEEVIGLIGKDLYCKWAPPNAELCRAAAPSTPEKK